MLYVATMWESSKIRDVARGDNAHVPKNIHRTTVGRNREGPQYSPPTVTDFAESYGVFSSNRNKAAWSSTAMVVARL